MVKIVFYNRVNTSQNRIVESQTANKEADVKDKFKANMTRTDGFGKIAAISSK